MFDQNPGKYIKINGPAIMRFSEGKERGQFYDFMRGFAFRAFDLI